jgi:hypothetical protein
MNLRVQLANFVDCRRPVVYVFLKKPSKKVAGAGTGETALVLWTFYGTDLSD